MTGSTGNAGEVGHMVVKAGGPLCGCGAKGCMEALASKTAIQRRINKAVRRGTPTVLSGEDGPQGRAAQERRPGRGRCRRIRSPSRPCSAPPITWAWALAGWSMSWPRDRDHRRGRGQCPGRSLG